MKILKASDSTKRIPYKPSKNDIQKIILKKDEFKMSGDGVFHTIQGEGPRLGYPITFIRLHFCNLACTWCDTFYTWQKTAPEFWTEPWDLPINEVHGAIRKAQHMWGIEETRHIYRVNFTGGEPLIQQDKIISFLSTNPEYYSEIETNGTILPKEFFFERNSQEKFFFNCSPKLASSGNPHIARLKPEVIKLIAKTKNPVFKFVCSDAKDIEDLLREYENLIPFENISIMPEGVTKEENARAYEKMMNTILRLGLATHPRAQNIMFDGSKRGV